MCVTAHSIFDYTTFDLKQEPILHYRCSQTLLIQPTGDYHETTLFLSEGGQFPGTFTFFNCFDKELVMRKCVLMRI